MATPATVPVVGDLLEFLNLDASYDPQAAEDALTAALDVQRSLCDVSVYTASLREAALRRAAMVLVARSAPLGQVDAGNFGAMYLPRWDNLVERLEADYRRGAFA